MSDLIWLSAAQMCRIEPYFPLSHGVPSVEKGRHSVGVAPQYASLLGKNANCQTLVSVTLASREVPVMAGLRLFLPEQAALGTQPLR